MGFRGSRVQIPPSRLRPPPRRGPCRNGGICRGRSLSSPRLSRRRRERFLTVTGDAAAARLEGRGLLTAALYGPNVSPPETATGVRRLVPDVPSPSWP